ncbi:GNAT family N-acetyltransferase [Roseiterribacter gracilis]|uniref:N-acetyltransferase n=1 Tax=Roseiterribacter gracilis TaxID=2812848 RepID=A0A8S8XFG0_9PROT|nr:N-acetyltransferase [Rhodospirillales bacterium TMPK1]
MHDSLRLLPAEDAHFDWMIEEASPRYGLSLPPGGIHPADVLTLLRNVTASVRTAQRPGMYLIVDADEVVGLCGFLRPPTDAGEVEIGYGIAGARQGRGFATSAVRLLLDEAALDAGVQIIVAGTAVNNPASQRVLEKNGFDRCGEGHDEDDGPTYRWMRAARR